MEKPMGLNRLRRHYAELRDSALREALAYGPAGYASPDVWQVIVEEAAGRGVAPPAAGAGPSPDGSQSADTGPVFGDLPGDGVRYAILAHPGGRLTAVKRGFCWPAFFFTWIWACAKGLLDWGGGLLLAGFVLAGLTRSGEPALVWIGLAAGLLLKFVVASEGNGARERSLVASGGRLLGTVPAMTPEEALAKVPAEVREPVAA